MQLNIKELNFTPCHVFMLVQAIRVQKEKNTRGLKKKRVHRRSFDILL